MDDNELKLRKLRHKKQKSQLHFELNAVFLCNHLINFLRTQELLHIPPESILTFSMQHLKRIPQIVLKALCSSIPNYLPKVASKSQPNRKSIVF